MIMKRKEKYLAVQQGLERHLKGTFITGNWWELDEALYSCADNVLGEPKSIDEALNSTPRNNWKKALDAQTGVSM